MDVQEPAESRTVPGQELLDALPGSAAVVDRDGVIRAVNQAWLRFCRDNGGEELLVSPPASYADGCRFDLTDEDGAAYAVAGLRRVLDGQATHFEHDYPCHAPQQERWFRLSVTPLASGGALVLHLDITAEHQRAAALLDASPVAVLELDADGVAVHANRRWSELTGQPADAVLGRGWLAVVEPAERAAVADAVDAARLARQPLQTEARVGTGDGSRRLRLLGRAHTDAHGVLRRYVVSAVDVTAEHQRVEELSHLAYHDELTDIPTRVLFGEHLHAALARLERPGDADGVAVLFFDLDDFKQVNDHHGHAAGDLVLRVVAGRIREALRPSDVVARHGGDEFVVLLPDVDSPALAREIGQRTLRSVREPIALATGDVVRVSASFGLAFTAEPEDGGSLLDRADQSLYEAKADPDASDGACGRGAGAP